MNKEKLTYILKEMTNSFFYRFKFFRNLLEMFTMVIELITESHVTLTEKIDRIDDRVDANEQLIESNWLEIQDKLGKPPQEESSRDLIRTGIGMMESIRNNYLEIGEAVMPKE